MLPYGLLAIGEEITENTPIGERAVFGLQVMLIGMCVVFGVLLLLMAILYVFKLFSVKNNKKVEAPVAASVDTSATTSAASSDEDTVVAVATAAIAAARGESDCAFNIISIKKIVK